MSSWQLGSNLLLTFILASTLLYRYGNWYRHHVVITLAVLVAWYFSFIIIFVLPLDVSTTVYVQCIHRNLSLTNSTIAITSITNSSTPEQHEEGAGGDEECNPPWSSPGRDVLTNLWRVVYWSSQCLTWLILPIMQSFTKAGEFTIKGKLRSALKDNLIYYASYLFICGILLAYIVLQPDLQLDSWEKIKLIASSASNTWSLFLLVFMLGHGLIAIPRALYKSSLPNALLNGAYFKVAKLASERNDSEELLEDALDTFHSASQATTEPRLVQYLDVIYTQIPVEFRERLKRRRVSPSSDGTVFREAELVKLNRLMKRALGCWHRTETLWVVGVNRAIELEDVELLRRSGPGTRSRDWLKLIRWAWTCILRHHVIRGLAVCAGLLSLAVIWSEVTFFNRSPVLSLFAIFINVARDNSYNYWLIEGVATATIAYLCVCAYYTVFKIRFFNYYYLASGHQTDEYSLIFCGMLLCRLTPPLCLNFLGLIHLDSHIASEGIQGETSYTQVMGHMDVLSIISDGFNIYFPMGILIISILTWCRVGTRLLSYVGFQQFVSEDDEMTTEMIGQGSDMVKREKRRKLRQGAASERRGGGGGGGAAEGDGASRGRRGDDEQQQQRGVVADESLRVRDSRRDEEERNYYSLQSADPPPRDLFDDV